VTTRSSTLVAALRSTHGLAVQGLARVTAGETTHNFTATDPAVGPLFVKVYAEDADLHDQEQAIAVSEFAAADGVPVWRTRCGDSSTHPPVRTPGSR
jgi:hypothetical protein